VTTHAETVKELEMLRDAVMWIPGDYPSDPTGVVRRNALKSLDALSARLAAAELVVEAAREYMEAQSADWIDNGDPSDPDEAIPPWQGSLAPLSKALAAFDAGETTT
jgi:hypothetical protein